jgi:hypothetical protein
LKPPTRILLCIACVGIALSRASISLAASDTMPTLNVAPTCESEGRKQMALGRSSIEACKRSETEARRAVAKHWSGYQKVDMRRADQPRRPSELCRAAVVPRIVQARA